MPYGTRGVNSAIPLAFTFHAGSMLLQDNKKAAAPLQSSGIQFGYEVYSSYYLRRRRAAKPAKASRESVAVVGSGMGAVVATVAESACMFASLPPMYSLK